MPLKRKQIYLDSESERKIQRLAQATGLSEAEHIRRAIASYVGGVPDTEGEDHPLLQMIGLCNSRTGTKDAALKHDRYLYGRKP